MEICKLKLQSDDNMSPIELQLLSTDTIFYSRFDDLDELKELANNAISGDIYFCANNSDTPMARMYFRFYNSKKINPFNPDLPVDSRTLYTRAFGGMNYAEIPLVKQLPALLSSQLDTTSIRLICDKDLLSTLMGQSHVPKSWPIDNPPDFGVPTQFGKPVYIFKPVYTWAGVGIKVLSNISQSRQYLNGFRNIHSHISEYICNPLLFPHNGNNYKMHIRAYFAVTSWNTIFPFWQYRGYTARSPYTENNYENKDIHDTHLESTVRDIFWPSPDLPNIDWYTVNYSIRQALHSLAVNFTGITDAHDITKNPREHPQSVAKTWKDIRYGYQVMAADIMLTSDYRSWILEVNTSPGKSIAHSPRMNEYYNNLFDFEYYSCILPVLGDDNIITQSRDNPKLFSINVAGKTAGSVELLNPVKSGGATGKCTMCLISQIDIRTNQKLIIDDDSLILDVASRKRPPSHVQTFPHNAKQPPQTIPTRQTLSDDDVRVKITYTTLDSLRHILAIMSPYRYVISNMSDTIAIEAYKFGVMPNGLNATPIKFTYPSQHCYVGGKSKTSKPVNQLALSVIPEEYLSDSVITARLCLTNTDRVAIYTEDDLDYYNNLASISNYLNIANNRKIIIPPAGRSRGDIFARLIRCVSVDITKIPGGKIDTLTDICFASSHFVSDPSSKTKTSYTPALLADQLDSRTIINLADKGYLGDMMGSNCFVKTWNMGNFPDFDQPTQFGYPVYAIKVVGSWSGRGVFVGSGKTECMKILSDIGNDHVVQVCEYIANPLLWKLDNGTLVKFHIRVNILVTSWNTFAIQPLYRFCPAKKEYSLSHFDDVDIHDTHFRTAPRPLLWPLHQDNWGDIDISKIHYGIRHAFLVLVAKFTGAKSAAQLSKYIDISSPSRAYGIAKPYQNHKHGYTLLGMDVMFTRDYAPIILEINENLALKCATKSLISPYFNEIYNWEYRVGIMPILASREHVKVEDKWVLKCNNIITVSYYFTTIDENTAQLQPILLRANIKPFKFRVSNINLSDMYKQATPEQALDPENIKLVAKKYASNRPPIQPLLQTYYEHPTHTKTSQIPYLHCECICDDEFEYLLTILQYTRYQIISDHKSVRKLGLIQISKNHYINDPPLP